MNYLEWIVETQAKAIVGIATGEAALPTYIDTQPFDYWGFPPALVPLWYRQGPAFFGIWKHWLSDREMSFVQMLPDADFLVEELGRTADQFVDYILLKAATADEGLSPRIEGFAELCGVSRRHLDSIDKISEATGDDPKYLVSLENFGSGAPAVCFPDGEGYTGQFPTLSSALDSRNLQNVCSLEILSLPHQRSIHPASAPSWLQTGPKEPLFWSLLEQGDLSGAWFCLNSNGWTFGQVRKALPELAERSREPELARIAECWLAINHRDDWGY